MRLLILVSFVGLLFVAALEGITSPTMLGIGLGAVVMWLLIVEHLSHDMEGVEHGK